MNEKTKIHNERRNNHIKDLNIQDIQFSHYDLDGKVKNRSYEVERES